MSFEISWYIPQRIIHIHLLGELDLNAVGAMAKAINHMMQEGVAPVHILLDDAKGGRPPISLTQLKSQLEIAKSPLMGWIVGVGETDPVAKFLIPLLANIMNVHYSRVATIEDAIDFLVKQDMSLEQYVS